MDEQEVVAMEEALRSSLRHVPAPEGFTQAVQQRIAQREVNRQIHARQEMPAKGFFTGEHSLPVWWAAVAAMLAFAIGADLSHLRHQRQAVAAQQQVDYAMQLTTHALDEVEMGVNRSPAGRFAQLSNETQQ